MGRAIQVVLARHGRPVIDRGPVRGDAFPGWLRAYDAAPVDPGHPPPAPLRALAREAGVLVASPLPRAQGSLALLDPRAPLLSDLLREAPVPGRLGAGLRLWPDLWFALSRGAWLCGWSPQTESFAQARRRAASAAAQLAALAHEHGSVFAAGHGFMNTLIGVQLLRAGWRGPWRAGGAYWSRAVYRRSGA